jgi:hypothetical protein
MRTMKLSVECYSGRKADERRSDFGWKGKNIGLKPCSISGTTRRASSTRFEPMTAISIFFGNKHRCLVGLGSWFRFGRLEKNADAPEMGVRDPMEVPFEHP